MKYDCADFKNASSSVAISLQKASLPVFVRTVAHLLSAAALSICSVLSAGASTAE
jgi:hypothetical protein